MLEFFRKYQTYFFIVITFVIVISFSFFGTYNTLPANTIHEQTAFTAIDGTEISRRELEEMVVFIGSDNEDKLILGGIWGPNFLNNGVVNNDILSTGLANILVEAYPDIIHADLNTRLEKEKRFKLYSHPQANFISVDSAWAYVSPEMKADYDTIKNAEEALTPEIFTARVNLYLNEKKLPAQLLKQILRYQQKQFSWISPDPNLERVDLSLYGYHTLSDWFGPRFLQLVAEFIVNAGKVAEQKGYSVSKEEALADLQRNAESSFKQNLKSPYLGVSNSNEYLQEQLRRLNLNQAKAIKIWQQVMLFRRLFQDIGNAVFIDPLSYQQFFSFAKESIEGDLYQLPTELRFAEFSRLQKFQTYLKNISKNSEGELNLPTLFLSTEQIKKKSPELVQKKYTLLVKQVSKPSLQVKVGLKEMWNWETQEKNWEILKAEHPILGIKGGVTKEERLLALDSLDEPTRMRVDRFSRQAIVDSHPEWIAEALMNNEAKELVVGVRLKGGKPLFGLDNREELMELLEKAPLVNENSQTVDAQTAAKKLAQFASNDVVYSIKVLRREPGESVLSFAEADKEGVLEQLLDRDLEEYYIKNRSSKPDLFQKEDKSWRPFSEVKNEVANLYFEKLLNAIETDYKKAHPSDKIEKMTGDRAASLRFYSYMRNWKDKLLEGLEKPAIDKDFFANQWQLDKIDYRMDRSQEAGEIEIADLYKLSENSWTPVYAPINGNLHFIAIKKKSVPADETEGQVLMLDTAKDQLSDAAKQTYMKKVVDQLKEKKAISLDYLDNAVEVEPS